MFETAEFALSTTYNHILLTLTGLSSVVSRFREKTIPTKGLEWVMRG